MLSLWCWVTSATCSSNRYMLIYLLCSSVLMRVQHWYSLVRKLKVIVFPCDDGKFSKSGGFERKLTMSNAGVYHFKCALNRRLNRKKMMKNMTTTWMNVLQTTILFILCRRLQTQKNKINRYYSWHVDLQILCNRSEHWIAEYDSVHSASNGDESRIFSFISWTSAGARISTSGTTIYFCWTSSVCSELIFRTYFFLTKLLPFRRRFYLFRNETAI